MARRTEEEILAQRDAWLTRKAARDAGENIPIIPPLLPGEVAETPTETRTSEIGAEPEVVEPVVETPQVSEPEVVEPASDPTPAPVEASGVGQPQLPPDGRRTEEELLTQREAWMARKAAQEAGLAPPPVEEPAPTPQPVAATPAPAPAPKAAVPAAKTAAPAPKPKTAAKRTPKKATPEPIDPRISRRELLNYAWLASLGLFTAETVGLSLWFSFPNFKAGQFGGEFNIGPASGVLPEVNAPPKPFTDGKFWLVNLDAESPTTGEPRKGVLAFFKVCTHLGCLYDWVEVTFRFECPCHGSQFYLTGDYKQGPARRSLDRIHIKAMSPDGTVRAETDAKGNPLIVNDDDILVIDTGKIIQGSSKITPA